ncbi:MAG: hypothetical protein EBU48_03680, partial [Burkholderiaceae bacterium]|nr:hypothetical protein [Burkholderiaceae bacterium]
MENGDWTLFSPSTTPDLHDKYGKAFEQAYVAYEKRAEAGEIKPSKKVPAVQMWRKMLAMLFETGHPWITFKDPCNIRSPQQHVGVVHSSNLCTEITLNTNETEIAVCNLGSVNLTAHMTTDANGQMVLDHTKLKKTIQTAMRMLDNVIDIQDLRDLYATAFELEPSWLVEAASRRQKWIDQAQSLNIYMAGASGKKLDDTYKLAWLRGLKTTYYLRTMAATHVEKSTVATGQLNSVSNGTETAPALAADGPVCTMRPGDPGFEECEACQ